MTPATIRLTVNGQTHDVTAAPDTPLLHALRNDLGLNGPKYGCGLGECLRRLLLPSCLGGGYPPCLRLPRFLLLPHLPRIPSRRLLEGGAGIYAAGGAPRAPWRLENGAGSRPLK